jgi:hypothetical protein
MFWPIHPAAELFPMMSEAELQLLAEDIKVNGQKHKITLFRGQLLDGRNRARACEIAGVRPVAESMACCKSPTEYVLTMNLRRRQLSPSQLSMVAARARDMFFKEEAAARREANLPNAGDEPKAQICAFGKSAEKAAAITGVSPRSVEHAARVIERAPAAVVCAVDRNEVSVSAASDLVDLPAEEQERVIADGPKAVRAKAKEIRETKSRAANDEKVKPESNPDFERVVTAVMKLDVGQLRRLASVVNGLLKDRDRSAS